MLIAIVAIVGAVCFWQVIEGVGMVIRGLIEIVRQALPSDRL